jgi:Flp pilus assembly protein TadG
MDKKVTETSRKSRGRARDEAGIAAIEFALFLPLLLILLLGIIDFGMLMTSRAGLVNASREGVRAGIILTDPPRTADDIETVVKDAMTYSGWDSSDVAAASVTVAGTGGTTGTDLTVQIESNYSFFILSHLIPSIADDIPLRATTTMKHE